MRKLIGSLWVKVIIVVGVCLSQSGCELFEIAACALAGGYWGEIQEDREVINALGQTVLVQAGTGNFACLPRSSDVAPACAIGTGAACASDRPSKP